MWIELVLETEERWWDSFVFTGEARLWPFPEPGRRGGVGGIS